jgi:hypothetical protein
VVSYGRGAAAEGPPDWYSQSAAGHLSAAPPRWAPQRPSPHRRSGGDPGNEGRRDQEREREVHVDRRWSPMLTATEVAAMLHLHMNTVKRLGACAEALADRTSVRRVRAGCRVRSERAGICPRGAGTGVAPGTAPVHLGPPQPVAARGRGTPSEPRHTGHQRGVCSLGRPADCQIASIEARTPLRPAAASAPAFHLAQGASVKTLVQDDNYCRAAPVLPTTIAFVLPANAGRLVAAPGNRVAQCRHVWARPPRSAQSR